MHLASRQDASFLFLGHVGTSHARLPNRADASQSKYTEIFDFSLSKITPIV